MKESGSKLVLPEDMSYSNTYFWMQNATMNSSNTISNDQHDGALVWIAEILMLTPA